MIYVGTMRDSSKSPDLYLQCSFLPRPHESHEWYFDYGDGPHVAFCEGGEEPT